MKITKRITAFFLCLLLISGWIPAISSDAATGDITFVSDGRTSILVDEVYSFSAQIEGGVTANKVSWYSSDQPMDYISYVADGNKLTITGVRITDTNAPIKFTAVFGGRSASISIAVVQNTVCYFTDVAGKSDVIDGSSNASITDTMLVNSTMQITTNRHMQYGESIKTNVSNNNGNITVTELDIDTYIYNIEAAKLTATGEHVLLATDPYTYTDSEGFTRTIIATYRIQVIDGLVLNVTGHSMYKGENANTPAVWTGLQAISDSSNPVTWKVSYGKGESAVDVSDYIKITTSNDQKKPTISVSSELPITEAMGTGRDYTITASQTVEGKVLTADCTLTIKQPVTGVSIFEKNEEKQQVTLFITGNGDGSVSYSSDTLTALVSGYTVGGINVQPDVSTVQWICTDENTVSISQVNTTCKITAQKPGNAAILVSSVDDPSKNAIINVTVRPKVSEVEITNGSSLTVNLSEGFVQLFSKVTSDAVDGVTVLEEDINREVQWTSSNENLAKVDKSTGYVTLLSSGSVSISCTSTDDANVHDEIFLTINIPVSRVELDDYRIKIGVGESYYSTLTLHASPDTLTPSNQEVTWESSDTEIAVVDNKGMITGVAGGNCTILVRADEGEVTATCEVEVYEAVSTIELNKSKLSINMGEETVLEATVAPKTATDQNVTWVSDNPSYVQVTQEGLVRGLQPGVPVAITAYIIDNKGKEISATCVVTVEVPIVSLSLSEDSRNLTKGDIFYLSTSIAPSNATNTGVVFGSTNEAVATVTNDGQVTAMGGGACYITCTSLNRDMVSVCYIYVTEKVSKITLSKSSVKIKKGKKVTLKATVSRPQATEKGVQWTSSNKKIATVSSKGVVKGKAYGTVTIKCKAVDGSGKYATCKVTVKRPATSIKISKATLRLHTGYAYNLKATVLPKKATNKNVKWSSSNSKVAKVSTKGKVVGVSVGSCTITCTTKDGTKLSSKCKVTVIKK